MSAVSKIFYLLFLILNVFVASGQNDVLVGAIRWDAWVGGGHPVGVAVENALSPPEYHYRVPFFGEITGPATVKIKGTSQEILDNEIYYASYAGLDYFAFVWYHDTCQLSTCRHNYLNSSVNHLINYCLIVEGQRFLTEMTYSDAIAHFKNVQYQRLADGRPLFYFFGTNGISSTEVSTLRNLCIASGAGNPYIVLICTGEYVGSKAYGFDAITMYGVSWLHDGVPYQEIVSTEISQWNYFLSEGLAIVPHVTTGWDKRPRYDNPVFWEPPVSPSNWVEMGTPEEIGNHLLNAIQWVGEHPENCQAHTVLVYAWNEFDEGGWLCPTLPMYEGTARIDALHKVLKDTTENITASAAMSKRISLYPNPASHHTTVTGIRGQWVICDIYGNVKMTGMQSRIDISSLAPGMYVFAEQGGAEKLVVTATQ